MSLYFSESMQNLDLYSSTMNIILMICIFVVPTLVFMLTTRSRKGLPPGSLGIPFIGQSLTLLRAMKSNTADQWFDERAKKYGPVSKLTLFGKPTVYLHGSAATKFMFTADSSIISHQQTKSFRDIMGDRSLLELSGDDHKRVRAALMTFLKPESLKHYIGKIEIEIQNHLQKQWQGQDIVTVLPAMKNVTFSIICSTIFGIKEQKQRDELISELEDMIVGLWSIPIDLPFTTYRRSLRARDNVQRLTKELVEQKSLELMSSDNKTAKNDLISTLISMSRDNTNEEGLTDVEIVQNVTALMIAGYETSAHMMTFMMRYLSQQPSVYANVLKEQEEIAKTKAAGEFLTWEDINKMKYTWRVALETLRVIPPLYGSFRKAMKDIEYDGYLIPKGWHLFLVTSKTHMDESLFPEPEKFDPTRFEQNKVPPYSFIGFGGGPRICPGMEFVRIETLIMMHYLVTRFTWKLCHPNDNVVTRVPMPTPTQELPIYVSPRSHLWPKLATTFK